MSCEIQPARHNHQPIHQQGTKWAGKAWCKMTKNANLGPNLAFLGHICQQGITPVYPRLKLSHSDHSEKILFSSYGSFFGARPFSGRFGLVSLRTLNFGPSSTKLGGTVRAIKKWPTMTTDSVRAGIAEKQLLLRLAEKCFLAKNAFFFLNSK